MNVLRDKGRLSAADLALLLLAAACWGVNNILVKIATQYEPPLIAAAARFLVQSLVLLPFLKVERQLVKPLIVVALLSGPLHFSLLYSGFAAAREVAPMTVILQLWIPISTLLSVVVLKERITPAQLVGMGVAFAGIVVMMAQPGMFAQWQAALMVLCAGTFWAASAVWMRKAGDLPVMPLQLWMALLSWPLLASASWWLEGYAIVRLLAAPWPFWAATVATMITAGIIGNGIMYRMVRKHEVARTTPILLLTPVFSVIAGVLILDEALTLRLVIGTAMTIAGLLWLTAAQRPAVSPAASG